MSEEILTPNAPIVPDAPMHLVKPKEPVTGTVVKNELCMKGKSASFIRHLAIDISGTPLEGRFLVGQSFGVIPPGVDDKGRPHAVRLYSIACPSWGEDGQGRVVSTTPKRVIDERSPQKEGDDPDDHSLFLGVCSNYMCDLRVGDKVLVSGPNGKRFLLPVDKDAHDYLFVATGTGIAPFRGMAMELLNGPNGPCKSQIHLVMGSPYTTDLLYDDLFTDLANRFDNFHYHTAISREARPGSTRGIYVDRLIDERMDVFGSLLAGSRTLVYMCGLIGMQFGMYQVLMKHGLHEHYMTIKDELRNVQPGDWQRDQMRRFIKPNDRFMLEVY